MDYDKETRKLLRYIYKRKKGVSEKEICDKFNHTGMTLFLVALARENYLIAQDDNGEYPDFSGNPPKWEVKFNRIWHSTPKSNALIEREFRDFQRWMAPMIISIFALLISIIHVILSSFNSTPIEVKILPKESQTESQSLTEQSTAPTT